jgi:hypothetical protein
MLAADALNDGTKLSQEVVKRDGRVRFEDIRRYVHHEVLLEEYGWAREEEEQNMRREEKEEDAKSRERRGGTAMVEPHARRGRPAWSRSSRIANVRQRDKRDRDDAEEKGGQSPRDAREFGLRGARCGNDDSGIRNLFIVKNIIQCEDFPLILLTCMYSHRICSP